MEVLEMRECVMLFCLDAERKRNRRENDEKNLTNIINLLKIWS